MKSLITNLKFLNQLGKLIFSLLAFACISSCSSLAKNDQEAPTKIRIVDIAGKPKPVKLYVPESNVEILAGQGMKINQATGELLSDQSSNPAGKPQDFSTQNPTQENSLQVVNAPPVNSSDIQSSVPVGQSVAADLAVQKLNPKSVAIEDDLVQEPDVEYDMSASGASRKELVKVANENKNENKKSDVGTAKKFKVDNFGKVSDKTKKFDAKGVKSKKQSTFGTTSGAKNFIQIGSFSTAENANNALKSAEKVGQARIKQIDSNSKKSYRVLLGPISDQKKAKFLLEKAVSAGYKDAFLTKD